MGATRQLLHFRRTLVSFGSRFSAKGWDWFRPPGLYRNPAFGTVLEATGAIMQKRVAIYVRVSTDKQTIENQVAALRQIAKRRGWQVVEQYHDAGISGAKGRDGRPGC